MSGGVHREPLVRLGNDGYKYGALRNTVNICIKKYFIKRMKLEIKLVSLLGYLLGSYLCRVTMPSKILMSLCIIPSSDNTHTTGLYIRRLKYSNAILIQIL